MILAVDAAKLSKIVNSSSVNDLHYLVEDFNLRGSFLFQNLQEDLILEHNF